VLLAEGLRVFIFPSETSVSPGTGPPIPTLPGPGVIILPPGTVLWPTPLRPEIVRVTDTVTDADVLALLRELSERVNSISSTLGTKTSERDQTVVALLKAIERGGPGGDVDWVSLQQALSRVEGSTSRTLNIIGDRTAPGGLDLTSLLALVQAINATTRETSATTNTVKQTTDRVERGVVATAATVGDKGRAETPEPASGMNDIASTSTAILRELRLLEKTISSPTTLSRTGPSMQFGNLPDVVPGFAYDINGAPATVQARELGLTLQVLRPADCDDGPALAGYVCVQVLATQPAGQNTPARTPLLRRQFLKVEHWPRLGEWATSVATRAASFSDNGFHYAIVINSDDRGRYAVIRRCTQECK
jgi:hypothetical protein